MSPAPIWGSASNVRFLGRSRVPGGSSKSRNSEGYTTAMNVLQGEGLGADGILANDWRIYSDFAQVLIGIARPLCASDPMGVDLKDSLYALDSTTIDLCLSLCR